MLITPTKKIEWLVSCIYDAGYDHLTSIQKI